MALMFPRPGELRGAVWSEFDFETSIWSIPAARMKMRRPHHVPLSSQAIKLLRDLQALTGSGEFLFPSIRSSKRPISNNTMNAALRRLERDEISRSRGFPYWL
jgi:integrase